MKRFEVSLFAAAALLSFEPYGVVTQLKNLEAPHKDLSEKGPVLTLSRIQKLSFEKKKSCAEVFAVFKTQTSGKPWAMTDPKAFEPFEPYSDKDRNAVLDCDEFPCAVKLNASEVAKMKSASRSERFDVFFDLVRARVKNYLEKGERKEYEFAGDPVDPFALLGAKLKGEGSDIRGKDSKLYARIIDLKDARARPIRQIIDERYAEGKSGDYQLAVFLSRDVYTAHYFDSWGEYEALLCNEKSKELRLIQAYLFELDLLKKEDMISVISRGAMKKNIREGADRLMDDFANTLSSKLKN